MNSCTATTVTKKKEKKKTIMLLPDVSGINYLVDTGAGVSVIPPQKDDLKHRTPSATLLAANGSGIVTYGEHVVKLDFGMGRMHLWTFTVAKVTRPILGLDFLIDNKFVVDPAAGTITDRVTGKTVDLPTAPLTKETHTSVNLIIGDVYGELLSQFPAITAERSPVKPKHNIVHRIPTQGGPVYCKPRRLTATAVKAAFEKLLEDGVISRSTSSWCSPLHLVVKKDFSWRPVGDLTI